MGFFQGLAVETAAGCVIWMPTLIAWAVYKRWSIRRGVQLGIFLIYITAVFHLVGLPSLKYFRFEPDIYLGAFYGILDDRLFSILNVFLFIPFGFLLPLLCRDCRTVGRTVLLGFLFSLFIECSQMFCFRLTDVNDLITNTFGALVGACAAKVMWKHVTPRFCVKELTAAIGVTALLLFVFWQYLLDPLWLSIL